MVRFYLDDGTEAVFETDLGSVDHDRGEEELMGRASGKKSADEMISESGQRFESLVQRIRPVAQTELNSLKELNTPQEINLEFGVKLRGKAGVVFASAAS